MERKRRMKVILVDHTTNPEHVISKMAAICYNSDTGEDACARRITRLLDHGHLATLRFAYATFLVEGVSRVTSHQFVRSKHLDFLQESQRYVDQTDTDFTVPSGLTYEQEVIYHSHYRDSLAAYEALRKSGIKKEDARLVLPEASHTRFYVTGNFQAWNDFLKLRAEKHAQWELRHCAEVIAYELYKIAPNIFKRGEQYAKNVEYTEMGATWKPT